MKRLVMLMSLLLSLGGVVAAEGTAPQMADMSPYILLRYIKFTVILVGLEYVMVIIANMFLIQESKTMN